MILEHLYKYDIHRHIEGVVKADEEKFLLDEVKEYVITNEIEKHLSPFFEEYVKPGFSQSVWISGFFGSGKSHLLKMLSLLLEDREVNGQKVGKLFLEKNLTDFELRGNLEKALKIPAKAVLFNIDQKANVTSKNQADAILAVFMRVFNEMQGYYAQMGYVAEFERDMDEQGLFQKFKDAYQELNGNSWEIARESILLEPEEFANALGKVKKISNEEALKVMDNYEKHYDLTIETFAKKVKKYIDKQQKGFRLIFCVDEIGQYISDNTKLMLNLQTLAESLQTICKGQAFLIVTSQNSLDNVIGDMNAKQANDFSKIQGRFSIKIPLTSANADEVIQKRLLEKKDEHKPALEELYEKEKNNLSTLYRFVDSRDYYCYRDPQEFVYTYPFIPYQFYLFQDSIRSLSSHNAFQGKHQSVGERSMLGVYQHVAKANAKKGLGTLVKFSELFNGISSSLRSEVRASITQADKLVTNELAREALKALFMVKYVKQFKATAKNIAILLIPSIDVDITAHQKQVQEALNLLEQQTYIQRVGEQYEFLTDEEKDVENEIKGTDIDSRAIGELLSDIVFKDILKDNKVRFDDNKHDYQYARKMDDALMGKDSELYVHFITPLNIDELTNQKAAAKSMGAAELLVHLPPDVRLVDELKLYRKTEKYIQQTRSDATKDSLKRILSEKGEQNVQRRRNLVASLSEAIGNARMYVNGTDLSEITTRDPLARVRLGFQHLIRVIYPNLKMLKREFREDDLKQILLTRDDDMFKDSLSEAEQEVLMALGRSRKDHERATTKILLDRFGQRPYGWYQAATLCLIAMLYKRGKVVVKHNGKQLDEKDLLAVINNNREFDKTVIEVEEDISPSQVKKLKEFHQEFFGQPNIGTEPREVSELFKKRMIDEVDTVKDLYARRSIFPFLEKLEKPLFLMQEVAAAQHPWFYSAMNEFSEALLDAREELIYPVKEFIKGNQSKIYSDVQHFLSSEKANLNYLDAAGLTSLHALMEDPAPYRSGNVQKAKTALDEIKDTLKQKIEAEKQEALSAVQGLIDRLKGQEQFAKLDAEQQEQVIKPLTQIMHELGATDILPEISDKKQKAENKIYHDQMNMLLSLAASAGTNGKGKPAANPKQTITLNLVKASMQHKRALLETEEDVEKYIAELREKLLEQVKSNKQVIL